MKRGIILLLGLILLTSFISADIIINKQPKEIYNLGDLIEIPATVKATKNIDGNFQMDLICNGPIIDFYKNGVKLSSGEEKKFDSSVVLTKEIIGTITGKCKIKMSLRGEEPQLTNEFRISDNLKINLDTSETEFNPGTNFFFEGSAVKENGDDVEGFIEIEFLSIQVTNQTSNETTTTTNMVLADAVSNGFFSVEIPLAENMAAGIHPMRILVYEKDANGEITNQELMDHNIRVLQFPTSLEIIIENQDVEPGTSLKTKAILHDQTGGKIDSTAIITIKRNDNTILEQTEKSTDEFLELPVAYNEPPEEWKVVAVSNEFMTESTFNIIEKKDVKVKIINNTLILTNIGNVLYNDTVLVKIGDEPTSLNISLDVDETKKYKLSAPEGEYQVEIVTEGESMMTANVLLTGKAINVKEASNIAIKLIRHPFVWVFILAVLGFVAFTIFRKGYKRSFFGYMNLRNRNKTKPIPLKKNSLINSRNQAELSLSIKGDKQNVNVVCLKIKNLKSIESTKSNAEEKLQEIVDSAEEHKAATYENQGSIFFILAPIKTKTFHNEKVAIEIAQKIKETLTEHNKLAKQKIDFGISLNYGTIVAKQETDSMKFMSMGTLITTARKIASLSDNEIFIGEKLKSKLESNIKTEKHTHDNVDFYTIKEIKNREEHKDFIKNFLKRLEGEKKD